MEFPRSADEYIYSSEIGRNAVQANFFSPEYVYSSEINVFKEIGVANFLSSEYFHQAEIGRNAVQYPVV